MLTRILKRLFAAFPSFRRAALEAERALYDEEFFAAHPSWPLLQPPSDEIEGTGRLIKPEEPLLEEEDAEAEEEPSNDDPIPLVRISHSFLPEHTCGAEETVSCVACNVAHVLNAS